MAGATEFIGNVFFVRNVERLMHPVTGNTVGKFLPFKMWLMTFHTVGDISVFVMMTDCTVKTAMGTRVVFDFIDLGRMTCVADGNVIFTKDNMQGLVRVLVTTEARCFYFKMGPSFMTLGALGDNIFFRRAGGVATFMTVKAGDFRLVPCAVILILMDDFRMTFYTVAYFQYRISGPGIPW